MRSRSTVAVVAALIVVGALTISAAAGAGRGDAYRDSRPTNAKLIAVARASTPRLFSIFPGVMGKKKACALAPGWGHGRVAHGVCATSINFRPPFADAYVSFTEVWPRGHQTWAVIERWQSDRGPLKRIEVLDTQWHGDSSGGLGN